MYIAPSSDHLLLILNVPFKVILRKLRLFSDVWSENIALFKKVMTIHSNPQYVPEKRKPIIQVKFSENYNDLNPKKFTLLQNSVHLSFDTSYKMY